MALGIDDFSLTVLILGSLLGLVFLWYISAKSRHRRQSSHITQNSFTTVDGTFQSPSEMSDRREEFRGSGEIGERQGLDSARGAVIGGNSGASAGGTITGENMSSTRDGRGRSRGNGREGADSGASGGGMIPGRRETSGERRKKGRRGKKAKQGNDDGRGEAGGVVRGESSRGRTELWASQDIVVKVSQRTGEKFTFFWGPGTVFSQWYPARFVVEGVEYNCTEQYMMHQKARLFGDEEMAECILKSEIPKEQKAMGRQVQNFDLETWNAKCKGIVKDGNMAKFSQNAELKEHLLATAGSSLVEASPFDRIWGIGLASDNPKATERRNWRGTNWLGVVLTQVRDELLQDSHSSL